MKPPNNNEHPSRKQHPHKKRFLQLYTSKAYCDQRSKLVQPHDTENSEADADADGDTNTADATKQQHEQQQQQTNGTCASNSNSSSSSDTATTNTNYKSSQQQQQQQLAMRRSDSFISHELDEEHVLSPRIVEAVTHSTQVVWANCQKTEGLLGRSDIKLQTAIGMPVGVDESGNVWVVVMFSPNNVESTSDAIDYLQYISRSAASTSIPCLLPVVGDPFPSDTANGSRSGATKAICNGSANNNNEEEDSSQSSKNIMQHNHSLVSIKATKQPDHTQELGDGVTAKFVSFNINDDEDITTDGVKSSSNSHHNRGASLGSENDLRMAPKDDWGIPMLPETSELGSSNNNGNNKSQNNQLTPDAIDTAITDAFDEASYGVWSTIMNSAGGERIKTSHLIATKMHLIQERLEEFATAFLGMSVFDVADVWTVSSNSPDGEANNPILKCLFTVAATKTNSGINYFREVSSHAGVQVADGAVGKAYSSGYPVWSSVKELIFDTSRHAAMEACKIETAFAVPIFSAGDVSPSCVLSCYSLLPAESVPFVLNFVQKAVRLLWSGLDRVNDPHASVGKLWKDVGPADLGEMAADVEMQKAFIGKKRPRSQSLAEATKENRDRSSSLANQMSVLPSLAPSPNYSPYVNAPINAPPAKGMQPAPLLPNTVQECSPNKQEFVFLDSGDDGHWAVQQAVQSVGEVQLWNGTDNVAQPQYNNYAAVPQQQQQQQQQQDNPPPPMAQHQQQQYNPPPSMAQQYQTPLPQYKMSYVNYKPNPPVQPAPVAYPPPGVHADDPATIVSNLMEFNAMAQMHTPANQQQQQQQQPAPVAAVAPNIAQTGGIQHNYHHSNSNGVQPPNQHPAAPLTSPNFIKVIPMGKAQGSVILTGPQQNMYCTSTTQSAIAQSMDPSLFAIERKPCRIQGCNSYADTKRPYCEKHCGNRQCERVGCTKCAQGATRFCIAHGGGRRCTFPGCDKGARDKYFCAAHGGGKRCKKEGCTKSAVGGSNFCTGHGGGKRCQVPGCDKSAQSSTRFCVKHGGGKKCQQHGCEKVARGRTLYCAAHGGGVRCKLEGCNRVAIGKAQLCRAHGGGANSHFDIHAAAI